MKNNSRMTQRRRGKSQKNNRRGGAKKKTPQTPQRKTPTKRQTPPQRKTPTKRQAELYEDFMKRFNEIAYTPDVYLAKEDSKEVYVDRRVEMTERLLDETITSRKDLTIDQFNSLKDKFEGFIDKPYSL